MRLITWLWAINLPAVAALLIFTLLAWKDRYWSPAWRIHYTLVAVAGLALVWFLANWNLLAIV
jgi:hypothetical protein